MVLSYILFRKQVTYLSLMSYEGISPDPSNAAKIRDYLYLTTVTELKRWTGRVNYYIHFIKRCSGMLQPLTNLYAKDDKRDSIVHA